MSLDWRDEDHSHEAKGTGQVQAGKETALLEQNSNRYLERGHQGDGASSLQCCLVGGWGTKSVSGNKRFSTGLRKSFFTLRTVRQWESLPGDIVQPLQSFSRPIWTKLWDTWSEPGLSKRLDWRPLEVSSNLNYPWFCNAVFALCGLQISVHVEFLEDCVLQKEAEWNKHDSRDGTVKCSSFLKSLCVSFVVKEVHT